jgi:hypothetical protein|uniref:Uncharacterized protein n=2 Tax=Aspergillus fumigatus TaxID=746128 RepID=H9CJR2_ASPFU|nr:hypothetical protein AFUA_m0440 [Aspergillus fumigatus]AFE02882.1 hypothetical protein AFUD_m0440 [Aspergillus fumigatus]QUL58759.1 hypothetical protein [Aspergillus fumigatus]
MLWFLKVKKFIYILSNVILFTCQNNIIIWYFICIIASILSCFDFYYLYLFSLDIWSDEINIDASTLNINVSTFNIDVSTLNMSSGDEGNYFFGFGGGDPGNNQGGNTNPEGGAIIGIDDQNKKRKKEDIWQYSIYDIYTKPYNPLGNRPPMCDRQLGELIECKAQLYQRFVPSRYPDLRVGDVFNTDSIIDKIARERLLGHILDYKFILTSSYNELELNLDTGYHKLYTVKITPLLIYSLKNSPF